MWSVQTLTYKDVHMNFYNVKIKCYPNKKDMFRVKKFTNMKFLSYNHTEKYD